MNDIVRLIDRDFPLRKIVIVGDLVADQFLSGTISRVSREAPVFILRHDATQTLPGGAANTAANIASLGAKAVLVGVVGNDANGNALLECAAESGIDRSGVVVSGDFTTTTKIRVLAGQHYAQRQQVIRIDYENQTGVTPGDRDSVVANLREAAKDADAIVVSDYGYGAADPEVGAVAREVGTARGIPVLVDSRFRLAEYPGMTTATPNQDEVEKILGPDYSDADCAELCRRLGFESLLVTRGNRGMLLVSVEEPAETIGAVGSDQPVDVTGAGDTVMAVYALGLASGLGFAASARLANHAGSIVVMKKGTAVVSPAELKRSLSEEAERASNAI